MHGHTRRAALKQFGLGALAACVSSFNIIEDACAGAEERMDWERVKGLAKDLAKQPFAPSKPLPESLHALDYDKYRLIAFRHERALWRDEKLPFWIELHHPGFLFGDAVEMSLVQQGAVTPVPFDSKLFQYRGELAAFEPPKDIGYAGFRLLCKLPTRPNFQEFCSFLGASYFRAIASNQIYGASARGLALNIGLKEPEEFPRFRSYWIEQPKNEANTLRIWALLDSPSVAGAYQFVVTPGLHKTTLDVSSQLTFRQSVKKLGLAPITSMWMWDERLKPKDEHRPHVHDSDGLLISSGSGEWLWRPLRRPEQPRVSSFQFDQIKGFGLMQRERRYDSYHDDEAKYHLRPGVWITPREPWGPGAVELLELPSNIEWHDNMGAYWVPKQPVQAGESCKLNYQVAFTDNDPPEHAGGRAMVTDMDRQKDGAQFTVVFRGETLAELGPDEPVQPMVTTNQGQIEAPACAKLPDGAWRLQFRLRGDAQQPSELRAFLRHGNDVLTETWSFLCVQ